MAGNQITKQQNKELLHNPLESLHKVGSSVSTYTQEETKANMKKFWEQLLGVGEYVNKGSQQGDMVEGEAIFLSQKKQLETLQQEAKPAIRAAYDAGEILRSSETSKKETKEITAKLNEIIGELNRLSTASIILEKEVTEATGQSIVNPGKYHVNFFEWLLIEIRQARIQVEDAGSWIATVSSKDGKKRDYWNMYKKHGTKFGLSGERSKATQTA